MTATTAKRLSLQPNVAALRGYVGLKVINIETYREAVAAACDNIDTTASR